MTHSEFCSLGEQYGVRFELLTQATSTNSIAFDGDYSQGDAIFALEQSEGRGQRGNVWKSSAGLNLTFSLVFEPTFLPAEYQFLLSQSIALGISDMLVEYGLSPLIKWTNDIYIGNSKIAGVLIENVICGHTLSKSVVGIGLNVNEIEFDSALPNPTSMRLLMGHNYNLIELFERLYVCIMRRYKELEEGYVEEISQEYNSRLYRLNEWHDYYLPDGSSFKGAIRRVERAGELIVEDNDNLKSYLFKEIMFTKLS